MAIIKMVSRNTPKGFIPRGLMELRVAGLREHAEPSDVKVFNANGELIRTEKPTTFPTTQFNNRKKR